MITHIGLDDIEDLAIGSAFLGTGGGGDPYLGSLLCREAIGRYGPAPLIDVAQLADDAAVFGAAAMGAPTVMIEKLFSIEDQDRAVRSLERFLGRSASAIISLEIGGCNSMMPVAYAALRGLPIVDADGMGRAFPQLQMTSFNIAGVRCAPMTLADEHGNVILFETEDGRKAEEFARPVVAAMGAAGCMSCYPMTGAQVRRASVPGTLTAAIEIGRAVAGKQYAGRPPVERLLAALCDQPLYGDARCVFEGKITSVERVTRDGWVFGTCRIEALGGAGTATVVFQNENLSVTVDGELRCIVPDLLTIVDSETAHAIPTERLTYGQRVSVVACAAPPQLTTEAALPIVGPKGFGLTETYAPLASLSG
ncbi:conserved hypothetical protein [Phenylobacterium zucineum HLK1]|uniref:DUF917 domain-containing protein n=1 Tax=Phenylobacterium zucineum (strain HLK1) TaxID=450851 RepID=B4RG08_PHEZH|nr:DUF917 domain-containing protein [Phenylobacterium zucineum]ACG78821.1 conserved hypothetical protein [Phenylobacterium zucineum HLK1]